MKAYSYFVYLCLFSSLIACQNKSNPATVNTNTTTPTATEQPVNTASAIDVIEPKDFEATLLGVIDSKAKAQLVDVRTAEEFAAGNIHSAVNIDFYQNDFKDKIGKLDKSNPVFVYCAAGGRSNKAATILKELGFSKIYDLKGGYTAWAAYKGK